MGRMNNPRFSWMWQILISIVIADKTIVSSFIVDIYNKPIQDANIYTDQNGTSSDKTGYFSFECEKSDIITITHIAYKSISLFADDIPDTVENRNNQMSIYFNEANMFEPNQNSNNNISRSTKSLLIEIDNINTNDSDFKNLVNLLNQSKGEMPVYIKMDDEIIEYNNLQVGTDVKNIIDTNLANFCRTKIINEDIFQIIN